MLSMPIMSGRIGKWILALSEFDLRYESAKGVKGQIMADFVTQHCGVVGVLEIVVAPGFKNKTRHTPYVSPESQISHIATNRGNINRQCLDITNLV